MFSECSVRNMQNQPGHISVLLDPGLASIVFTVDNDIYKDSTVKGRVGLLRSAPPEEDVSLNKDADTNDGFLLCRRIDSFPTSMLFYTNTGRALITLLAILVVEPLTEPDTGTSRVFPVQRHLVHRHHRYTMVRDRIWTRA